MLYYLLLLCVLIWTSYYYRNRNISYFHWLNILELFSKKKNILELSFYMLCFYLFICFASECFRMNLFILLSEYIKFSYFHWQNMLEKSLSSKSTTRASGQEGQFLYIQVGQLCIHIMFCVIYKYVHKFKLIFCVNTCIHYI